ncbi:hypothetical protein Goshw_008039 [Gossypium schwendimanii]|uniref:Uncharacterized protein n=1 Tax=Gossypium schwendimanii TaxID=34291 RepID=A0A7J9N077_GOSSC|nr:hypothetical protein [Gossypium schwendimanii]
MQLSELGLKLHRKRKVIVWLTNMYWNYGILLVSL